MNKRILSLLLVVVLAIGLLAGCGSKEQSAPAGSEEAAAPAGAISAPALLRSGRGAAAPAGAISAPALRAARRRQDQGGA